MLTHQDIVEAERTLNRLSARVHEAFEASPHSAVHAAACREFHSTEIATDFLWSDETRNKIKAGDRDTISDALLFLEVDPVYFRSGYLKEKLIDALKCAPLSAGDEARVRQIILRAAGGPDRREFRRFCRLAAVVTSDVFEQTVEQLARERDAESHGKYSYLLHYLRQHRVR